MALYRNVQTSFWTDPKVADDFTPEDKYFYLYLFTNPHTNLSGCYEVSIRQIANETGYGKESVENLINRFVTVHKVIQYSKETKEILIVNWHKFNWTKSKDFRKALDKEIDSIKNIEFKRFLRDIADGVDTVPRPSLDGVGTTVSNTISITNTNSNKKDKYIDTITNRIEEHNYSIYISNILREWFLYKREKKQSYTDMGTKKLLNKIDKVLLEYPEEDLGRVINECMERNYQGIIFDMLDKKQRGSAYMDAIKNRVSQVDEW